VLRKWWRPRYWRWWWRSVVPGEAKLAAVLLAGAAFLGCGFIVADRLSGSSGGGTGANAVQTTIRKLVTVRVQGKTRVRQVPVRQIVLRPRTEYETRYGTRTITTPGAVRTVLRRITERVPIAARRVVTVRRPVTVPGATRIETRLRKQTETRTETQLQMRTQTQIQTRTKVVTSRVTVRQAVTDTATRTVTVTSTITVPETETETETKTKPPKH
jgi:hypothetical protein